MLTLLSSALGPLRANTWLIGPVLFSLLLLTFDLAYGIQHRVSEDAIGAYFSVATTIAGLLMAGLAALALRVNSMVAAPDSGQTPRAFALVLSLISLLATVYFYSGPALWPTRPLLAALTGTCLVLSLLRRFDVGLWFLAGSGIGLFTYLALATPIDVNAANMLPFITASCDSIVLGESPFGKPFPAVASALMYYLPLNVLPYCPLQWADVDVRWLNVALLVILLLVLARRFDFSRRPEILGLTVLPLLLSPMSFQMGYYGHIWSYWLMIALMGIAFADRRYLAAAVFLGVALLTRQMALFVGGMLGAAYVATLGWRRALRYAFMAAGLFVVGLLITQAYSGIPPQEFYLGISNTSKVTHANTVNPIDQISFSGRLIQLGLRDYMMFIQAGFAALLCLVFLGTGRRRPWQQVTLLGLGYATTMSLSVFMHRYFYGSGLLLVACGLAFALYDKDNDNQQTQRQTY